MVVDSTGRFKGMMVNSEMETGGSPPRLAVMFLKIS